MSNKAVQSSAATSLVHIDPWNIYGTALCLNFFYRKFDSKLITKIDMRTWCLYVFFFLFDSLHFFIVVCLYSNVWHKVRILIQIILSLLQQELIPMQHQVFSNVESLGNSFVNKGLCQLLKCSRAHTRRGFLFGSLSLYYMVLWFLCDGVCLSVRGLSFAWPQLSLLCFSKKTFPKLVVSPVACHLWMITDFSCFWYPSDLTLPPLLFHIAKTIHCTSKFQWAV